MVAYIIMFIVAYLIGSVNFSVLISKKMAGFDVREKGSGNAGATNVLRTVGKKAAILTLCCDILKGVATVVIACVVGKIVKEINPAILVELAALGVVIGHTFPVFFGFKGGKGVATSLGIILIINWQIGLACLIFALVLMAITRMVSLGSISAAVLFAVLTLLLHENYITGEYDWTYIIFGILLASFVIFNHRTNLKRIISGTENKLSFKKKKDEENNENIEENVKENEEKIEVKASDEETKNIENTEVTETKIEEVTDENKGE